MAGPVEAAALGNVLVQARAAGAVSGDLAALRRLLRAGTQTRTYTPSATNAARCDAATKRVEGLL